MAYIDQIMQPIWQLKRFSESFYDNIGYLKAPTIKGRFIHQSQTGTEIILRESGGRERFISSYLLANYKNLD